ncbi:tRNA (adenosine(37)-N6)-threonylcarbamoyltransferase complex dimerization subunit type 1 TsaB [Iodidimonas muriae]|uniref:tRNA (Adenosine(37)-N6)-threonylcarbamoyltransferase complex dimerization subunit type 1 TsaB n=1 Tax=Iodidimonas muriae TaxID=261467 RepID=A0ABQ2LBB2_9PROT|nr:tRNA (adenosine(37)-N6)-threonylcarbamoyltransferase complex dimerization subunit type 1 TsaB [Iodidimonas muriae]GER05901.1 tRNA (adenosine(37)-N6)-threonylcarbamoyltransferase complex dimerization subunit type 1 TsaB [Kordiimonadales bacterium JCM 17843]GGO07323.1 tRNA (adenosine(37)-N6)-threonylcarbamoyltransferase complex dimerization subunit type 1 TsaB [Iodidimonas muriae]
MMTPVYLAFDTGAQSCSVALLKEGGVPHILTKAMRRGQAEALLPMIDDLVRQQGLEMAHISHIAVTTGPGSFAGVRVGIAAARGLALALSVPAIGFTTFEALAFAARTLVEQETTDQLVLVALAARGDQLYCQSFDKKGQSISAPALSELEDIAALYADWRGGIIGSGAEKLAMRMPHARMMVAPEGLAAALVHLAAQTVTVKYGRREHDALPSPFYLRPPDAKQSTRPGLTRLDPS